MGAKLCAKKGIDAYLSENDLPLGEKGGGFLNPFSLITWPLSLYWPMVLATFLSRFSDLPFKEDKSEKKSIFNSTLGIF